MDEIDIHDKSHSWTKNQIVNNYDGKFFICGKCGMRKQPSSLHSSGFSYRSINSFKHVSVPLVCAEEQIRLILDE